jgi:hypothetical protein
VGGDERLVGILDKLRLCHHRLLALPFRLELCDVRL